MRTRPAFIHWGQAPRIWTILGFLILAEPNVQAEDVTISRSRLEELTAAEAENSRLRAEISELKSRLHRGGNAYGSTSGNVSPRTTEGTRPLPIPPPLPSSALPDAGSIQPTTEVNSSQILAQFATSRPEAISVYLKKPFRVRGIPTEVDKDAAAGKYEVVFRVEGIGQKLVAEFQPPDEMNRVYLSKDRTRIVGESGRRRHALAQVGVEGAFTGRLAKASGDEIRMTGCRWIVDPLK